MAHHHKGHYEQVHGMQDCRAMPNSPSRADIPPPSDDDLATEPDEPPDQDLQLKRTAAHIRPVIIGHDFAKMKPLRLDHHTSLLTEGLAPKVEILGLHNINRNSTASILSLTSSKASWAGSMSAASTAELTSDGGLTSPARTASPSPPLPPTDCFHTLQPLQKDLAPSLDSMEQRNEKPSSALGQAGTADIGLVRKRCITFACNLKDSAVAKPADTHGEQAVNEEPKQQPKRPCSLRFACPSRPSYPVKQSTEQPRPDDAVASSSTQVGQGTSRFGTGAASQSTIRASSPTRVPAPCTARDDPQSNVSLGRTEATRFHEFASSVEEMDEWMNEPTQHKRKLTVNDTLGKEKSIRRLGEEVEEEVLQDEEPEDDKGSDDDSDGDEEDDRDEDESDDGNESDDEDGFADSDGETEPDSDSVYWAAGESTAATSVEQLDQGRRRLYMAMSDSSLSSIRGAGSSSNMPVLPSNHSQLSSTGEKLHVTVPKLPDSTEYVCGTLDEDRGLEEAYVLHREQKKHSARPTIPQDIDPSFPTSDLEDEDDDDLDIPKRKSPRARSRRMANEDSDTTRPVRTPPMRLHSPPPLRRDGKHKLPAPPGLASPSPKHWRLPRPDRVAPTATSPGIHTRGNSHAVTQRPTITRTKSLPRTPNPYYHQCGTGPQMRGGSNSPSNRHRRDPHRRCAVDIVCGLEVKRQRLREKAWHKYCQRAAKNTERKPIAGQGAERMRELGLEMAGRVRGKGLEPHGARCVLSI